MDWIQTKDKLPKNEERVLILCKEKDGYKIYIAYRDTIPWTTDVYEWVLWSTSGYKSSCSDAEVIAWMPLPEVPQELLF